jgi:fluoroacetyl-CoA thioesterase
MRDTLAPGLTYELRYTVSPERTVPKLLPDSPEFAVMPQVLATGYMVGLIEWACILALAEHLDWPREQTVGTHVNLSHTAATPVGMEISIRVELAAVDGRKLEFKVEARDEHDVISTGRHERFVIDAQRFGARVAEKASSRAGRSR